MGLSLSIDRLKSLTIYRNIIEDPVVNAVMAHVMVLSGALKDTHPGQTYGNIYYLLANTANPISGLDAWQNHLLDLILDDDNPFSHQSFTRGGEYNVFAAAVQRDLNILQNLFHTSAQVFRQATLQAIAERGQTSCGGMSPTNESPEFGDHLPLWEAPPPARNQSTVLFAERAALKQRLAQASEWDKLVEALAAYYATHGCGIFNRYIAFKWQDGELHGISQPDPITFSDLIGYEDTRREIIDNTMQFISGFPANNMLLYGDRGTGKSSTVKALLNEYWPRGLRLVEVSKQHLVEFTAIIEKLSPLKHSFILFVDDLSFEENETGYKDLKALLEGGLEKRPANMLIYATSNRRHLIKETSADRESGPNQEIRTMDSVQEKLSLADRFGVTVIFPTPGQDLFINIAKGLARQRNLPLDEEDISRRALQWSMWHNGRSPRAARQFIDQLEGQLALRNLT